MSSTLRYRIDLEFRALERQELPESAVTEAVDRIVEIANSQACDVDVQIEQLPLAQTQA